MATWEDSETPPPPKASSDKPITVEAWAATKNTPAWLFAAAKALHGWPIGKELDESDYTEAIDAAANVKIGG